MKLRTAATLILCFLSALVVACGSNDGDDAKTSSPGVTTTAARASRSPARTSPSATSNEFRLKLIAKDVAFDTNELTMRAGAHVTLDLTNSDDVPHNFAAYRKAHGQEPIFVGEVFSGPGTATIYQFDAPGEAGTYFFRCDVHPDAMKGELVVEAAAR